MVIAPIAPPWIRPCAENSSCTETEKSYLCKVLHFNRQNLLIGPPNGWAAAYGSYWKYPTEH